MSQEVVNMEQVCCILGYLLSAREGMVEARDVGHDGLLVRAGCTNDVCRERGVGWGWEWAGEGGGLLNRSHYRS